MKRILAYFFVAVMLLVAVASTSVFRSERIIPVTNSTSNQQSPQGQHPSFFAAGDLCLSTGINNEQIRLSNSIQNISYRIYPSLLNAFRTNHSTQLADQKISTGTIVFLLSSAKKQLNGYYLYHLRKLLI